MTTFYKMELSNPKLNAQRNLCGRTHYVDDDTLRWHKSRVLSSGISDNGMLFWIVTSDALDMNNSRRGYRYVVFDIFGHVLSRVDLEHAFKRREQATKAMWVALNLINAHDVTLKAIENAERDFASEMALLRTVVEA